MVRATSNSAGVGCGYSASCCHLGTYVKRIDLEYCKVPSPFPFTVVVHSKSGPTRPTITAIVKPKSGVPTHKLGILRWLEWLSRVWVSWELSFVSKHLLFISCISFYASHPGGVCRKKPVEALLSASLTNGVFLRFQRCAIGCDSQIIHHLEVRIRFSSRQT